MTAPPSADRVFAAMDPPPPRANGWWLLAWTEFQRQFDGLVAEVAQLRAKDPEGYGSHPQSKLLATLLRLVTSDVPRDPASPDFRQGNTLGEAHRGWFRAKFHQRFRLFFRFRSADRMIVYVWINSEGGLRRASDRNDPYNVFRRMLERGSPPSDFEALLRECAGLGLPSAGDAPPDPSQGPDLPAK